MIEIIFEKNGGRLSSVTENDFFKKRLDIKLHRDSIPKFNDSSIYLLHLSDFDKIHRIISESSSSVKFAVLENTDSSNLGEDFRKIVKTKNVKFILKEAIVPFHVMNSTVRSYRKYQPTDKLDSQYILSEEEYSKIIPFPQFGVIDFVINQPVFLSRKNRPLDVSFAGRINVVHREKMINKMESLQNKYKIKIVKGRHLNHSQYVDQLRNSKIVISPWGNGETCYREFEAWRNGAIVIKPNIDLLKTCPILYENNKTYIACDRNYEDLDEKISNVLNRYEEFDDMRIEISKRCLEMSTNEFLLSKIKQIDV